MGRAPRRRTTHRLASELRPRSNVLQPRVAALPLPWIWIAINYSTNPNGVAAEWAACSAKHCSAKDTTPLGLVELRGRFPRVAGNSQPWAGRWNPVGIPSDGADVLP